MAIRITVTQLRLAPKEKKLVLEKAKLVDYMVNPMAQACVKLHQEGNNIVAENQCNRYIETFAIIQYVPVS